MKVSINIAAKGQIVIAETLRKKFAKNGMIPTVKFWAVKTIEQ